MKYLLMIIIMLSTSLEAAKLPYKLKDSRLSAVAYSPDNVVRVRASIGHVTLIQLEKGETIIGEKEGIAIGDSEAWHIILSENNISFKPKAEEADTNISFTTNKGRTYFFDIVLSKYPHYLVRMVYEPEQKIADKKHNIPCSDGKHNFSYSKWGENKLAPAYMWDDGRFTCLKFTDAQELPVAYKVAADGTESITNYHLEADTMVVHAISNEFRLRLGDQVLGLKSDQAKFAGYNKKATSIKATRQIKHD